MGPLAATSPLAGLQPPRCHLRAAFWDPSLYVAASYCPPFISWPPHPHPSPHPTASLLLPCSQPHLCSSPPSPTRLHGVSLS